MGRGDVTGFLAIVLVAMALSGGCAVSPGEPRPAPRHEVLRGEIADAALASESEVALWVDTDQGTVKLLAGFDALVSVAGVPVPVKSLQDYVGFSATALCRRQGDWCLDTRLIALEYAPAKVRKPVRRTNRRRRT
jgi:hypothetical protein